MLSQETLSDIQSGYKKWISSITMQSSPYIMSENEFEAGAQYWAEKWEAMKLEYENLCKFATYFENQCDVLKEELEMRRSDDAHTCHAQCKQHACVLRREVRNLKIQLESMTKERNAQAANHSHVTARLAKEREYSEKLREALGVIYSTRGQSVEVAKEALALPPPGGAK